MKILEMNKLEMKMINHSTKTVICCQSPQHSPLNTQWSIIASHRTFIKTILRSHLILFIVIYFTSSSTCSLNWTTSQIHWFVTSYYTPSSEFVQHFLCAFWIIDHFHQLPLVYPHISWHVTIDKFGMWSDSIIVIAPRK